MKRLFLLFFVLIIGITNTYATHNRAGEITYQHISGLTYKIIVTTYTKENSYSADRCELTVYFGDGDTAIASRINGPTGSPCSGGIGNGESLGNNIKKNIYVVEHTYSGAGTYIITMEDPNRNDQICNIPNSVETSFFIRSELIINPFLGINNSPTLLNPPIDNACANECFEHNPGAFDADGDSLAYSLVTCYANGSPIFGYSLPPNMSYSDIDAYRGDIKWCSPPSSCQGNSTPWSVNIAILVQEYRRLLGSNIRYYVGSVLRDMQITVENCINNPPKIKEINDTCIVAGTNLNFNVSATDVEINIVSLTATGGPFEIAPKASFLSTPAFSPVSGVFNWKPNCDQVQLLPYSVVFKATDSNINPLTDFKTIFIRVIAPAPTALTAIPSGASIVLNWKDALCNSTLGDNPLISYLIYRKNSCDPFVHDICETGVSESSGYTQIGTTEPTITTFTDNENGKGLTNGVDYSYILVANYSDGSKSYASLNVCAKLVRDVPIITNVSIISTGASDSIWTHWVKPIGTNGNLDTIANPPPYEYRLMKASGFNPPSAQFAEMVRYTYPAFSKLTDTGFVSTKLNTQDSAFTFRVDFYSNSKLVGSTNTASSVFLTTAPTDNEIDLSWQEIVPWSNYKYKIYRETSPGSKSFTLLDSTVSTTYADTGLVNGKTYCYKIISTGQFSDTTIYRPLFNSSEIKCDVPIDIIPPCQPTFTVGTGNSSSNCETGKNLIEWVNPNTYCSDDAMTYKIYFGNTTNSPLLPIDEILDINTTNYVHQPLYEGIPSVAGCYALTATDSSGNESPISTKHCVDNCPIYNLPNVFTPNGDGKNDFFTPIPPYRYIRDVDFKVYNRWGALMFETKDVDILWDGKNSSTKKVCPDGTYFYVCTVNEIRVDGIIPHVLKGFIQVFNEPSKANN